MCLGICQWLIIVDDTLLYKFGIFAGQSLIGEADHVVFRIMSSNVFILSIWSDNRTNDWQILGMGFEAFFVELYKFLSNFKSGGSSLNSVIHQLFAEIFVKVGEFDILVEMTFKRTKDSVQVFLSTEKELF